MKKLDTPRILIADPDAGARALLCELLAQSHITPTEAETAETALELLEREGFDLVIAELQQPDMDGLAFLAKAQQQQTDLPIIMVAAFGSVSDAVNAMRDGATDFISKPFTTDQVQLAIDKALANHRLVLENQGLREALDDRLRLDNMVMADPRMREILKCVKAVAKTRTTVLITGESGTGKTLLARAIHQNSSRRQGPFIEVNSGALPESLLESELFGHVRGAFTGAVKNRPGKFEAADGGTIFLDEIGTSTPGLQVKLLRVLQDRVIERVGDSQTRTVDVRIILATNKDLEQAVAEGQFREDLYYRIHVVTLEVPPLRERPDDIPYLAEHFRTRLVQETGKAVQGFSAAAMRILVSSPWPGNVRQLENVVERAVVLTEHDRIEVEDLPPGLRSAQERAAEGLRVPPDAPSGPLKEALLAPEKLLIEQALRQHGGNRQETAQSLGINRSTLFNKMRKFGLL